MNETPVLVGISQLEQRPEQPATQTAEPWRGKEPIELMIDAVAAAAEDFAYSLPPALIAQTPPESDKVPYCHR